MKKTSVSSMYQGVSLRDIRKKVRPGVLVRVKFTDTGARDCLVVEKITDTKNITSNTEFRGFFFATDSLARFCADQIIASGGYLNLEIGL